MTNEAETSQASTQQSSTQTQASDNSGQMITMSAAEFQQIINDTVKNTVNELNGSKKQDENDFSKRDAEEKAKLEKAEAQKKYDAAYSFVKDSKDIIEKNKELFKPSTLELYNKDLGSVEERANKLQLFAARDFFSDEKNLNQLIPADIDLVKRDLLDEHGQVKMSGQKAWHFVEYALHIIEKDNAKDNLKKFIGGGGGNGEQSAQTEVLSRFIDRVSPKPNKKME